MERRPAENLALGGVVKVSTSQDAEHGALARPVCADEKRATADPEQIHACMHRPDAYTRATCSLTQRTRYASPLCALDMHPSMDHGVRMHASAMLADSLQRPREWCRTFRVEPSC